MQSTNDSDPDKPSLNVSSKNSTKSLASEDGIDSQDTFCDYTIQDVMEPCSESIFSQEICEILQGSKKSMSSESPLRSSDVQIITKPVDLVILETESDSTADKINSAISVSDSSELNQVTLPVRHKSSNNSPIPKKRTFPQNYQESGSSTLMDSPNHSPSLTNANKTPIRSSPRLAKRSNSCNICCENVLLKPSRRLKRSMSADIDNFQNQKQFNFTETSKSFKLFKNDTCTLAQSENLKSTISFGRRNPIQVIEEECNVNVPNVAESQNFDTSDSQNIHLYLSPSTNENKTDSNDNKNERLFEKNNTLNNSETDVNLNCPVVLLSENNPNSSLSNGEDHKSFSNHTDQDSTVSVELDSPYNTDNLPDKLNIKSKPYISNGYSSSTPENLPFMQDSHMKKTFLISDSEGDTPTYTDFNKQQDTHSKLSISSKSDSSCNQINSSISPLNNGHSDGSHHISNSSIIPSFNVQMYSDENNDFLSMFIVRVDNEIGNHTLKEYQRLSKRLTMDPYAADNSKSNSPSSVTSGGLLHLPPNPRSSFMSTGSSSSASSRTSDGAFIIPQRPKISLSFHTPTNTTVKGWQSLKQTISDIILNLSDHPEDITRSPEKQSIQIPQQNDKKDTNENDVHETKNDSITRVTPKSSKKKVNLKTKRVLSSKLKQKANLSITNEEPQDITASNKKFEETQTPTIDQIKSIDTPNSSRSTLKGRKNNISSPAANLSSTKETSTSALSDPSVYPKGTHVLARWRDKMYYSGKIINILDNNKFEVRFDDGQTKSILEDYIIFGNLRELPLIGQSVYTKVDNINYEPSLVMSVQKLDSGIVLYNCTTDRDSMVSVPASDIYMTEDQAKFFRESKPAKSPHSLPGTPRRRNNAGLDLFNIIQGPRSARLKDKSNAKGLSSPSSPKAGPSSGVRGPRRIGVTPQRRQESESSEGGDSRASSCVPDDVEGVQPEIQKTPRKSRGIKVEYMARDLQIKGTSKQKYGKGIKLKNTEDEEEEIIATLGPIPPKNSNIFTGLYFLITCPEFAFIRETQRLSSKNFSDSEQYTESSEMEEDDILTKKPFDEKRLEEQLVAGGGIVYSCFGDIPKSKYSVCNLIVPKACLTAKFIFCLAANIKAVSHLWVIYSCKHKKQLDINEYSCPTGFSIERNRLILSDERDSTKPFKDKLILLCSEDSSFTEFWDRICSLAGANTKIISDDNMDMSHSIAIVTNSKCPDIVRNRAEFEEIPLVSTVWVCQCLIEGKLLQSDGNPKYHFAYNESD